MRNLIIDRMVDLYDKLPEKVKGLTLPIDELTVDDDVLLGFFEALVAYHATEEMKRELKK